MTNPAEDRYINSTALRQRYGGVSDMWVWRRLKEDPTFPKPEYIAKRRFWKLSELDAWDAARIRSAV